MRFRKLWPWRPKRQERRAIPPMPPQRESIMQATQAWFGDNALSLYRRDGDIAVLAMGGTTMTNQVFRAEVGQTVRAGPYEITVTGFGYEHERDVVDVIVSVPGDEAKDIPEDQDP